MIRETLQGQLLSVIMRRTEQAKRTDGAGSNLDARASWPIYTRRLLGAHTVRDVSPTFWRWVLAFCGELYALVHTLSNFNAPS